MTNKTFHHLAFAYLQRTVSCLLLTLGAQVTFGNLCVVAAAQYFLLRAFLVLCWIILSSHTTPNFCSSFKLHITLPPSPPRSGKMSLSHTPIALWTYPSCISNDALLHLLAFLYMPIQSQRASGFHLPFYLESLKLSLKYNRHIIHISYINVSLIIMISDVQRSQLISSAR